MFPSKGQPILDYLGNSKKTKKIRDMDYKHAIIHLLILCRFVFFVNFIEIELFSSPLVAGEEEKASNHNCS